MPTLASSASRPAPAGADGAPPLSLYLAGVGHVGGALLDQIGALDGRAPLHVVGACRLRGSAFRAGGLAPGEVRGALAAGGPPDWPAVLDRIEAHGAERPTVFVDATGAPEVADHVERLLAAGVSVVTPSKLANTRSQVLFNRLRALGDGRRAHYRYEATVGAGLPVIRTVDDLVATGDRVEAARGVFSGTMTYLFGQIERGVPFSAAVRAAVEQGYAEPDPRDDLSGEDVVRKLMILARTAGLAVERPEVEVEDLVPEAARGVPRTLVTDALAEADGAWADRVAAAEADGLRLRYVGRVVREGERGRLTVGVEAVPAGSPLGGLSGTDNLIEITTARYAASPLTVRGPGAGPEVTAAGVLADVLSVARAVGAGS